MNILAFDTSSQILSVGIARDAGGWNFISESGFTHSQTLLPSIDRCLSQAGIAKSQIELVACASGPGSFTGLRIGMSAAKGISLALGIPWVGVPTLDSIGYGYRSIASPVMPVLDARKGRVYCALYLKGERLGDMRDIAVVDALALADAYPEVAFVGPDAPIFGEYALERSGFSVVEYDPEPALKALASLAAAQYLKEGTAAEDSGPLYLREPEIG